MSAFYRTRRRLGAKVRFLDGHSRTETQGQFTGARSAVVGAETCIPFQDSIRLKHWDNSQEQDPPQLWEQRDLRSIPGSWGGYYYTETLTTESLT